MFLDHASQLVIVSVGHVCLINESRDYGLCRILLTIVFPGPGSEPEAQ